MADFINTIDLLGEEATLDAMLDGSITEFNDDTLTDVRLYAFAEMGFNSVNLPSLKAVSNSAFGRCTALTTADFKSLDVIVPYGFVTCSKLKSLIIRGETLCSLDGGVAFAGTPIEKGTGYIYVPRALVETYKTATNWSTYANQFRALEDYTVDGTIHGELDESKI